MSAKGLLDELISSFAEMPRTEQEALLREAYATTPRWVPNVGPQTDAYFTEADELFFGGSAGGGKSDLGLGLSLTEHTSSLVLRRYNKDAKGLADRLLDGILNTRDGWNGQDQIYREEGRSIEFGGCQEEKDKQRYKGRPHDLIFFDEISDFLESQYRFIIAWNRSAKEGQRCRVVCAGNPPTTAEGLWVIRYWGPWLDPTHPNPAQPGELRWFTTEGDRDVEVDGPGPHLIDGKKVFARSRTFIRSWLSDNPDLMRDHQYESVLSALPPELRDAYRDGKFDASIKDNPWQVIPTAWVRGAIERWTPDPPKGVPMCAIGADIAQGGDDNNVIAPRYDGWFAPLIVVPGRLTPLGTSIAGLLLAHRRDGATIVVDCGGGYGGTVFTHLKDNGIETVAYVGSKASSHRTKDQKLRFANTRSEALWRFREALDPDQPQGSTIMLPNDPELLSDLTAPTYEVRNGVIYVEPKEKLVERLGRSPDRGDAVMMSWMAGDKIASAYQKWKAPGRRPEVIRSHAAARRK